MKRFTILEDCFDDSKMVVDFFKSLVGNRISISSQDEYIILEYEFESLEDINNLFLSLSTELMVNILGYTSSYEANLELEKKVALSLIKKLNPGMYDIKSALLAVDVIENKGMILDLILDSSGIDKEFIKKFSLNNLNISQASKEMFIHRNTLNYKIDKLKEVSGFDLRCFIDAYILYTLAK